MRDYAELITRLKQSDDNCNAECCECSGECLSSGCNIFSEAADAIEELLAAVPKWISVEERLPEKHVEVLICTEDYGKNGLGFANTAAWDGSEWIETWNRKESIPYVSHWMPLPEPPKEDAE